MRSCTRCSVTAYVTTKGVTISPSCAQPSEIPSQCSNTKSKISFSHCRAQAYIFDFVFEHGKGNAIYDIIVIYNPTNNVDYIKYRTPKPHAIYKHIFALYVSQNVTAHAQSTSTTHFSCSSKYRRTSLYKTYHRAFDFCKSKGTG